VADFYANQNYIATNFCINKDKPWMHCNGHCQLAQKMKEEENKDKQTSEHKSEIKTEAFCINYTSLQPKENMQGIDVHYPVLKESIFRGEKSGIFHPPQYSTPSSI
jgi:hypothetical protein